MPRWDENGRLIEDEAAPRVRRWDANGNPVRETRRRGQSGSWQEEVGGALASINRGIPFAQDLVNLAGGLRGAVTGQGFQEGMRGQRAESQALQRDFRNRRPNTAAFSEGVGNALPMVLTAGASTAPQAAGGLPLFAQQTATALSGAPVGATTRGLPLFLGQTRNASLIGGVTGGVYGGSTGEAPNMNMVDRAGATNLGTGLGLGLGAATPTAVNAVSGAWQATSPLRQAIGRGVSGLPQLAPRANAGVGSMGGQMFAGGSATPPAAPPPSGPRIPRAAMGTIDRMADNARMSPDAVESALAEARRNPQGQVLVDIFGDTGVRRFRPIVQGPGQTGNRAVETARQRFQAAADIVINKFNRSLGVSATPRQALNALNDDYQRVSAEGFNPLWRNEIGPQARNDLLRRVQPFTDDPIWQGAAVRAQRIFDRDVRTGLATGRIDDNLGRYLHYMKMGLDAEARWASNPINGIDATELRGIREMQRQYVRALDEAIPGYREQRAQWGGIAEAEDALEEGATLIDEPAEDVAIYMQSLTPFARHHARIGFANELAQRIGLRGSVNGNKNVAEALGSPEIQRRVRAMFDDEMQAADFLDTLNTQNVLMRNAQGWGGNSSTFSNAAYGADEALNTVADMGLELSRANPGGALRRGVQDVYNAARGGVLERANNERGEALLRRVDTDDAADFARAVVEELRRRAAARQANTAAAQTGAAASGTQQGN